MENRYSREPKLPIKPLDMAVLLYHINVAAKDPEIGHVDADYSVTGLIVDMVKKPARIKVSKIESALYSCNMLAEKGKFWHPQDKPFTSFISDLERLWVNKYQFDPFYNILVAKK